MASAHLTVPGILVFTALPLRRCSTFLSLLAQPEPTGLATATGCQPYTVHSTHYALLDDSA